LGDAQFFTLWSSTVSAALGAIGGSAAAYFLTRQNDKTRHLRDEVTACNAAVGLCASIANTIIAIKRQQIKPMNDIYLAQCQSVQQAAVVPVGQPSVLQVNFDLNRMPTPWTCIDALNELISSRITSAFEPSGLAPSLTQAIHNQQHFIELRNALIEKFRGYNQNEKLARYFGISASPTEGADRSYPDAMNGIVVYTDDCLYFASLLGDVLTAHANRLASQLGDEAPPIKQLNFKQLQADGLMPNPNGYAAFEKQYRPKKIELFVTM